MGLIIGRKINESYYLLARCPIDTGEYIKITKISSSYGSNEKISQKDFIEAPEIKNNSF